MEEDKEDKRKVMTCSKRAGSMPGSLGLGFRGLGFRNKIFVFNREQGIKMLCFEP